MAAIVVLMSTIRNAQNSKSGVDVRVGLGTSFLGSGDILTFMIEQEVNTKLNRYFALSAGVGYVGSRYGESEYVPATQLNENIYS